MIEDFQALCVTSASKQSTALFISSIKLLRHLWAFCFQGCYRITEAAQPGWRSKEKRPPGRSLVCLSADPNHKNTAPNGTGAPTRLQLRLSVSLSRHRRVPRPLPSPSPSILQFSSPALSANFLGSPTCCCVVVCHALGLLFFFPPASLLPSSSVAVAILSNMASIAILRPACAASRTATLGRFRCAPRAAPSPSFLAAAAFLSRRSFSSYLVTPKELSDALKKNPPSPISTDPRVIPLCAAWFMPNDPEGRTGIQVYRQQRIPKARFFDLDKVIDKHSEYPHMLPGPKTFAAAMSELGIRREDTVVVYDTKELGIFSAPRVGWTLKVFGHPKVHLLNNFRLWVEEGYPTESGELYNVECHPYPIPEMDADKVASYEDVKEVALDYNKEGAEGVQIIDARSNGRWTGKDPEPRPGLSSGHMPGSINIPFNEVLDSQTKAFLPKDQLKKLFESKGVDPKKPIVSSCGTGVTAVVVDTALEEAGYGTPESRRVYDGSWT